MYFECHLVGKAEIQVVVDCVL